MVNPNEILNEVRDVVDRLKKNCVDDTPKGEIAYRHLDLLGDLLDGLDRWLSEGSHNPREWLEQQSNDDSVEATTTDGVCYKNYIAYLEMFLILSAKLGRAQDVFHSLIWNHGRVSSFPVGGNSNHKDNFVSDLDLGLALDDIQVVLTRMKEAVSKPMMDKKGG